MNVKVDKQENSKVVLEFTMDKETFDFVNHKVKT